MDDSPEASQPGPNEMAVASAEELEQASQARQRRFGSKRAKYRRLLYIFSGVAALVMFAVYLIMPEIRYKPIEIDESLLASVESEDASTTYALPPSSVPPSQSEEIPGGVEGTPVSTTGGSPKVEELPKAENTAVAQAEDTNAGNGLKSADQITKAWANSSGKVVKRSTTGQSQNVDASSAISFQNILFKLGSDELLDDKSLQQVSFIAEAMKRTKGVNFLVEGHTCDLGEASKNRTLSEKRAARIVNELIRLGVDDDRLQLLGFGAENPVVPNDSEANRQKNRRVMVYKQV